MRTEKQLERLSVAICTILRHIPEEYGLTLSIEGYVPIDDLIAAWEKHRIGSKAGPFTRDELLKIVLTDSKGRYSILNDQIRCNQGHSTRQVDLSFVPAAPPAMLYHGTAADNLAAIGLMGLKPGKRHYVHLSEEVDVAKSVGGRKSKEILVLEVHALTAHEDGIVFYRSDNGVWLTRACPPKYIAVH